MSRSRPTVRQCVGWAGFALVSVLALSVLIWRGDIVRSGLDPKVPFQTYEPPPSPDYEQASGWMMRDIRVPGGGLATTFFVHSTTYDGGRDWNGPIGDRASDAYLRRVVIPNYAGPFQQSGAMSVPRYRQASLYARTTLRQDAREARIFAYDDVSDAFSVWLDRHPTGPIILAGVEQGAELLDRLVRERVATDPALRQRLVGVYLMDVVVARDGLTPQVPACEDADQLSCVVGWSQVDDRNDGAATRRLRRALVWDDRDRLVELGDREALCVNPVSGRADETLVQARQHLGGANATGLEWGVRPAFLDRLVGTQCRDGLLRHTRPKSEAFKEVGSWADRRKARQYNLFYADIQNDVQRRLSAWIRANPS